MKRKPSPIKKIFSNINTRGTSAGIEQMFLTIKKIFLNEKENFIFITWTTITLFFYSKQILKLKYKTNYFVSNWKTNYAADQNKG